MFIKCSWPTFFGIIAAALLSRSGDVSAVGVGNPQPDARPAQETRQALLSFLTFSVIPDSPADALQIDNSAGDDSSVLLTQVGGGFTVSGAVPLYLEGYIGYARYDPDFVVSGVEQSGLVKASWQTFSATGGVGYDVRIAKEWVIRPIINFSLAHMTSTAALEGSVHNFQPFELERNEKEWLDDGWLNAGGIGGSLILDYERRLENYEADIELRYTHYYLTSLDSSEGTEKGSTNTDTLGLWGRLRFPTGYTAFNRPVRVVLEGTHSWFAANQTKILGFDQLTKVGAGLELDLGSKDIVVERVRLIVRYLFGQDISGVSLGFGISF